MTKTALVLAPHTDDGELGCGGTISRLIREGWEVHYVALSFCDKEELSEECKEAVRELGIPKQNLLIFFFKVREFNKCRQQILDILIDFKEEYNPDLVFIPSLNDVHQDHQVVAKEALRAFKKCTLLAYELPWNNLDFNTACFYKLTQDDIINKLNATECYKSQKHRDYMQPDFIKALTEVRGVQIGVKYAECFEVIRLIR